MILHQLRKLALAALLVTSQYPTPSVTQTLSVTPVTNDNDGQDSTPTATPSATPPAATFISPAQDLAFAMSIPSPESDDRDIYFTLQMPQDITWAAIGLGARSMSDDALILMTYVSSSGGNLTLSPRRSKGHTEPLYAPEIDVEILPGTGLSSIQVDDDNDEDDSTTVEGEGTTPSTTAAAAAAVAKIWILNARCSNCLSWTTTTTTEEDGGGGGSKTIIIDPKSGGESERSSSDNKTILPMLFATGRDGVIRSDDPSFSVGPHYNYGTFSMDLSSAVSSSSASVPEIIQSPTTHSSPGTVLGGISVRGASSPAELRAHAILMILCFVGLFPMGGFVLRLFGGWVRVHAGLQGLGGVLVIVAAGLGVKGSGYFTRTKKFNTAHQIIGLLLLVFLVVQFVLGFAHHHQFKKTKQRSRMAPVHVWFGRFFILLGVVNGFLGFDLAQSPWYNWILAGLVLLVFPSMAIILVAKFLISRRWRQHKERKEMDKSDDASPPPEYDLQPWGNRPSSTGQETSGGQHFAPVTMTHTTTQHVQAYQGQASVTTECSAGVPNQSYQAHGQIQGLGLQQATREMV